MVSDSSFFKKKFINYYHIDIDSIEDLLLDAVASGETLALSLSDCESHIILSSTGDERFQEESVENNKMISLLTNNVQSLKSEEQLVELQVTTHSQIEINKHIFWKRKLLLYMIFDRDKTNLALANKKISNIIITIENLLNHH